MFLRAARLADRAWQGRLACLVLLLAALACSLEPAPRTTDPPTLPPMPTDPPPTIVPADTGWQALGNGIELRRLRVEVNGASDRLWMARLDPARVRLRVRYDPNAPRLVSEWFSAARPLLAVNAGYFTEDYHATGLIVVDGARSGKSYIGFGGMLAVRGDRAEVRSLTARPYSASETLHQAVQAFPMLILPGGQPGGGEDDGKISRRTAVGQDRRGRIVFVVSGELLFTLKNLARFLAQSDLELETALNLDGGTSAGMMLSGPQSTLGVDSWIKIPAVIVAEAR